MQILLNQNSALKQSFTTQNDMLSCIVEMYAIWVTVLLGWLKVFVLVHPTATAPSKIQVSCDTAHQRKDGQLSAL
jgi:hypothetical protein